MSAPGQQWQVWAWGTPPATLTVATKPDAIRAYRAAHPHVALSEVRVKAVTA